MKREVWRNTQATWDILWNYECYTHMYDCITEHGKINLSIFHNGEKYLFKKILVKVSGLHKYLYVKLMNPEWMYYQTQEDTIHSFQTWCSHLYRHWSNTWVCVPWWLSRVLQLCSLVCLLPSQRKEIAGNLNWWTPTKIKIFFLLAHPLYSLNG